MGDGAGRTLLASGGENIKIWDLSSTTPVQQFSQHADNISNLCWSHNNQYLASSSSIGDKIVLNYIEGSSSTFTELAAGDKQTCIALNSTSRYLACGGKSKTVTVWDLKTKKLKKQYKGHIDAVTFITFNSSDTHIASGSSSGEVLIHNVVSGQSGSPLTTPTGQPIRSMQYSYFKKAYLAAVSDDGSLYLWDTNTSKLLTTFSNAHKAPATSLSFSPLNNLLLASCGLDKRILCYDAVGKKIIKTMVVDSPLTSLTFMHDGATLAAGSSRGKIFIFDLRKGAAPIKTLVGHKSSVQYLAFQNNASAAKLNGTGGKARSTPVQSTTKKNAKQIDHTPVTLQNSHSQQETPSNDSGPNLSKDPVTSGPSRGYDPSKHLVEHSRGYTSKDDLGNLDHNRGYTPKGGPLTPDSFGTSVISPLHDDKKKDSSNSYSRPDVLGSNSYDSSLTAGGIFSPLPNESTESDIRRTPIGSVSHGTTPYTAMQPITGDLLDRIGPSMNVNNNIPTSHPVISKPPQGSSSAMPVSVGSYQSSLGSAPDRDKSKDFHTSSTRDTPEQTHRRDRTQPTSDEDSSSHQNHNAHSRATPPLSHHHPGEASHTIGRTGQPVEAFQVEFIRNMIEDSLEEFKVAVHQDIMNLQVEMLRQFQIQQNEIQTLLQQYSVNDGLLAELERLREENKRLKSTF